MAEQHAPELDPELAAQLEKLRGALPPPGEVEAREADAEHDTRRELLRLSGVSEVLTDYALRAVIADSLEPTRALSLVRAWLSSSVPVLALFGPSDAGKTVASAHALARLPGRYHELGDLARHRPPPDRRHPDATWSEALSARLLVLDELGMEDDAVGAAASLHDLINRRLRRRTLLLANLDDADWRARYDPRTLSRLEEVSKQFRVPREGLRERVGAWGTAGS